MKSLLTVVIVTCLVSGCNSEQSAPVQQKTVTAPDTKQQIDPPALVPEPEAPTNPEPPVVELPSKPVAPPIIEPPKSTLPTFIREGISTITQQPYSGTVTRSGDAYLRYNQTAATMDKFELPEWKVAYRYEPFLEVLITNGGETLCARYSWKKGGFGYAKPHCLWSDTRQVLPLEDMKNAYYGFRVIESRVLVNGVVGLSIEVK